MQNLRLGYFEIIGWKSLKAATLRSLKILIISNDVPGNFSEMWKAVPNLLKAECDVRASAPKLVILSAAPDGSIKRHSIERRAVEEPRKFLRRQYRTNLFSLCGWGEVASVLVEKGRTATVRQNVSGFFDSEPRKVREALRSELRIWGSS